MKSYSYGILLLHVVMPQTMSRSNTKTELLQYKFSQENEKNLILYLESTETKLLEINHKYEKKSMLK